jgi:hypothetical protein
MTETNTATLERCYYRSIGPKLTVDSFVVEFTINGGTHQHRLTNKGWSYQNKTLQFLGYIESSPSEFDGTQLERDGITVPVSRKDENSEWLLQKKCLDEGKEKLEEADWFDSVGSVGSLETKKIIGGTFVEPGTGNKAGVPVE